MRNAWNMDDSLGGPEWTEREVDRNRWKKVLFATLIGIAMLGATVVAVMGGGAPVTPVTPATQASFTEQMNAILQQALNTAKAADAQTETLKIQIRALQAQVQTGVYNPPIPPGDLTQVLNSATENQVITLTPGGAYTLGSDSITKAGIKILCDVDNRAKITLTASGISINAPNVEIAGLSVTSGPGGWRKFIECASTGLSVHDCDADRITNFVVMHGDHGTYTNIVTGRHTGGDVFYVASSFNRVVNCIVLGLSSPNSEHGLRTDVDDRPGKGNKRPTDNVIIGGSWTNDSTSGKEVFAFREGDRITVQDAIIVGWARCGQDTKDKSVHVTDVVFKNCRWVRPLYAFTLFDIKNGVLGVTMDACEFGPFTSKQSMIRVGQNSKLHITNTTVWQPDGVVAGPLIGTDVDAVVEDDGTTMYRAPVAATTVPSIN